MHGAHQVAQKFTNNQFPLCVCRFVFLPSSFIKGVFEIGIRGICSLNLLISPVLDVSLEAFVNEPPGQSIQVNVTITAINNNFLKHT